MIVLTHCESAQLTSIGPAADYALCSSQWDGYTGYRDRWFGTSVDFIVEHELTFGKPPPYQVAQGAGAVEVLADALERAGTTDGERLRDALAMIHTPGQSPRPGQAPQPGQTAGAPGRRRRVLAAVVALGLAVGAGGCGVYDSVFPDRVPIRDVAIRVDERANGNQPVAFDLVLVYDPRLLEAAGALPAREWFARRGQFRLDYPEGFRAWEWEVVPGQPVPPLALGRSERKALAAFVFANYPTPGDHRARIDVIEHLLIRLGEKGFTLERSAP